MHLMSHWITNHGLTGEDPMRMGTSNSILCPLRVFPTKTQPMFIAGTNDAFWKILCTALGKQDWLADARFATNKDRVANRAILEPMIEEYFLQHTADELLDKLIPAGMACSAAYRISEAMASPHAKARGSVLEIDYPGIGPVKSANNPIKLLTLRSRLRRKSPMVGEHTVEIMREVGYSDAEIANLKNAKAIDQRPMKIIYSDKHAQHDPQTFFVRGVKQRSAEQPERAERLLAAAKDAGHRGHGAGGARLGAGRERAHARVSRLPQDHRARLGEAAQHLGRGRAQRPSGALSRDLSEGAGRPRRLASGRPRLPDRAAHLGCSPRRQRSRRRRPPTWCSAARARPMRSAGRPAITPMPTWRAASAS